MEIKISSNSTYLWGLFAHMGNLIQEGILARHPKYRTDDPELRGRVLSSDGYSELHKFMCERAYELDQVMRRKIT